MQKGKQQSRQIFDRGEKSGIRPLDESYPRGVPGHVAEFTFSLNTGLRLGSQYGASYEMIDWTRNVLDVPRTKNDEPVHIPLNSDVLAAIRSLPSWQERKGPIFRSQMDPGRPVLNNHRWFKPALKAAGISD